MQIQILPLTESDHDAVLQFVCAVFVSGSVLHRALGISAEEYAPWISPSLFAMAGEVLSFVARDHVTGDIAGCIVGGDYANELVHPTWDAADGDKPTPARVAPMMALLNELRTQYCQSRTPAHGECVLVDMVMVHDSYRRLGVYRSLRERLQQAARDRGYSCVVGELSSAATQNLCVEDLGHRVLGRVRYADFEFEGRRPFARIADPEDIIVVEGDL